MRVSGAQFAVTRDIAENAKSVLKAIAKAHEAGADVLLTPEGSLSGYTPRFDQAAVNEALEDITAATRQAGVALALGTCFVEPEDGQCYNQIRFYDRNGRFLGFHAKILLCGTPDHPSEGEINDYATRPLRTFELDGVRVGGLICNDLWANPECTPMDDPHLTQKLARLGARVIFHAVNGGRNGGDWSRVAWRYHETNLRMRARAARTWIVTVDNAHPAHIPCSAPSGIVGPDGQWTVAVEPQGERFFVGEVPV